MSVSLSKATFGDYRPVNWGKLVLLGSKAMLPLEKKLTLGSVVKIKLRVKVRQVVVMNMVMSPEVTKISVCVCLCVSERVSLKLATESPEAFLSVTHTHH